MTRRSSGTAPLGRRFLMCGLTAALLATSGLTACRDSEQDRPTRYDKGTYLGPTKPGAGEAERREYRLRARHQGFSL